MQNANCKMQIANLKFAPTRGCHAAWWRLAMTTSRHAFHFAICSITSSVKRPASFRNPKSEIGSEGVIMVVELQLKLPETIHAQLTTEAKKQRKSVNDLLIDCVRQHLSSRPSLVTRPITPTAQRSDDEEFVTAWALPPERRRNS